MRGSRPDRRRSAIVARPPSGWIRLVLLLPFLAVFGAPGAHDSAPVILGITFAYWYQAVWMLISAGLVYAVYRIEKHPQ